MNRLKQRLIYLLSGWGAVGLIYNLSDRLQEGGNYLPLTIIDHLIPFSPDAVWFYLSFFVFVPLGYLLTPEGYLRWLTRSTQLSALGAGSIYLLFPTTMFYPPYEVTGMSSWLLDGLISVDSSQNCFPSLHAALTILCLAAIAQRKQTLLTIASALWAFAILVSIIQLKRHLFIDLTGGVVLAWLCGWLAARSGMKKQTSKIAHE